MFNYVLETSLSCLSCLRFRPSGADWIFFFFGCILCSTVSSLPLYPHYVWLFFLFILSSCFCLSLTLYLSVSLPVCLFIKLSVICVSLFVCVCVCLCMGLSVCLFIYMSICYSLEMQSFILPFINSLYFAIPICIVYHVCVIFFSVYRVCIFLLFTHSDVIWATRSKEAKPAFRKFSL